MKQLIYCLHSATSLFELYLHVGMYGRMFGCIDVEDDVATATKPKCLTLPCAQQTMWRKSINQTPIFSQILLDSKGFLTCCNFLISQIYASFHLEPLVYKEMDTKIKIITDFYGQPKNLLYDLTSFILPEFFNSDGNPVQLILYDSNLNSPAAMAFQ